MSELIWVAISFMAAVAAAAWPLTTLGVGQQGVETGANWAVRVAFIFFWLTYTNRSILSLFHLPNSNLRRAFGLAFAAALVVHLVLVAWLLRSPRDSRSGTMVLYTSASVLRWPMPLRCFP